MLEPLIARRTGRCSISASRISQWIGSPGKRACNRANASHAFASTPAASSLGGSRNEVRIRRCTAAQACRLHRSRLTFLQLVLALRMCCMMRTRRASCTVLSIGPKPPATQTNGLCHMCSLSTANVSRAGVVMRSSKSNRTESGSLPWSDSAFMWLISFTFFFAEPSTSSSDPAHIRTHAPSVACGQPSERTHAYSLGLLEWRLPRRPRTRALD